MWWIGSRQNKNSDAYWDKHQGEGDWLTGDGDYEGYSKKGKRHPFLPGGRERGSGPTRIRQDESGTYRVWRDGGRSYFDPEELKVPIQNITADWIADREWAKGMEVPDWTDPAAVHKWGRKKGLNEDTIGTRDVKKKTRAQNMYGSGATAGSTMALKGYVDTPSNPKKGGLFRGRTPTSLMGF